MDDSMKQFQKILIEHETQAEHLFLAKHQVIPVRFSNGDQYFYLGFQLCFMSQACYLLCK